MDEAVQAKPPDLKNAETSEERPRLWRPALICLLLLLLEIYALLHDFEAADVLPRLGRPVIARFISSENEVRSKSVGTILWRVPVPGADLRTLDTVLTMPASRAQIEFDDGTQLAVEPDSLVVLDKTRADDAERFQKIVVNLKQGSLSRKVMAGRKAIPLAVNVANTVIEDEAGDSEFKIRTDGGKLTVAVSKGSVKLLNDEKTTEVKQDQAAVLESGGNVALVSAAEVEPSPTPEPTPEPTPSPTPEPKRKLDPPKMRKPKVRVRIRTSQNATLQTDSVLLASTIDQFKLLGLLASRVEHENENGFAIGNAEKSSVAGVKAKTSPKKQNFQTVFIDLEWDQVKSAAKYRLQISEEDDFSTLLLDKVIKGTAFDYQTIQNENKRKLYFRVASIDADGDQGGFSDSELVEIDAVKVQLAQDSLGPRDPSDPTPDEVASRDRWRVNLGVGAAYHFRTFKRTDVELLAEGSGFIPALVQVEVTKQKESGFEWRAGLWALLEKAEPTDSRLKKSTHSVLLWRTWFGAGFERWGVGAYASSSTKFELVARVVTSEPFMLIGATGWYQSNPNDLQWLHWRGQLGLVVAGGMGADVNFTFKKPIARAKSRLIDYRGFYGELEPFGRFMNIETSYGGAIKIGYLF